MCKSYFVKKGQYFIGDPAIVVRKNNEGDAFIQKLWDEFYKNPHEFREIELDGIFFYMTRTEGGDGRYSGIGTDTGTFWIIEISQLKDDLRFHIDLNPSFAKIMDLNEGEEIKVCHFNIYFENGFEVITS